MVPRGEGVAVLRCSLFLSLADCRRCPIQIVEFILDPTRARRSNRVRDVEHFRAANPSADLQAEREWNGSSPDPGGDRHRDRHRVPVVEPGRWQCWRYTQMRSTMLRVSAFSAGRTARCSAASACPSCPSWSTSYSPFGRCPPNRIKPKSRSIFATGGYCRSVQERGAASTRKPLARRNGLCGWTATKRYSRCAAWAQSELDPCGRCRHRSGPRGLRGATAWCREFGRKATTEGRGFARGDRCCLAQGADRSASGTLRKK